MIERSTVTASKNAKKTRGRPFEPGNQGGPGRPEGSRNRASIAADALAQGELDGILRAVLDKAKEGDLKAADIVLSRIWPARKGRPVTFTLPKVVRPADIVAAVGAIAEAMTDGTLTPEEGHTVVSVLEVQRRAVETADLERRITALEGTAKR